MLSIMPFSNADLSTPGGLSQAAGEVVLGATGGMAARVLDGIGLVGKGDFYQGIERMLPKGLSDVMKAARINQDGMTNRRGDVLLNAEEISAWESFIQALGIPPVDQAVVYERRNLTRDQDQSFQDRSTRLKNDYAKAVRKNDAEGKETARREWSELQEARVRQGYKRQPMSELLRAPQQQTKRERETEDGVQYNRTNRGFVQAQI
jgi:hypothetical protein